MQHDMVYPPKKLLLLSILCSVCAISFAQNNNVFQPFLGEISPTQQELINTLESHQTTKRTRVARINKSVFNADEVTANLFSDDSITFQRSDIGANHSSLRTWTGTAPEILGNAAVIMKGNRISGHISSVVGSFEIIPLDDKGTHLIIENDLSEYGNCANNENIPRVKNDIEKESQAIQLEQQLPQRTSGSSECKIRLLVAYTSGAQANTLSTYNRSMIEHIELAILQMNQGFANSLADQRVELAYLYKTEDTETGDSSNDISDLRDTTDGKWDEIHELRDLYHADMVALITDGSYSNMCGRAYGFNYELQANMFQITEYNCAVANFTLAHEFGHLQGCRHNVDVNETPFAFGHGFSQGGIYQTIMAVCCGGTRVNYWSNPYVYYPNVGMMGSLNFSYNTKALNISDSTVAHHRITPANINSVGMLGDDHLAHSNSTGLVIAVDTTMSGGYLILQSEYKVRLKEGFHSYHGSLGRFAIAPGCSDPDPLTAEVFGATLQRDDPPKTININGDSRRPEGIKSPGTARDQKAKYYPGM